MDYLISLVILSPELIRECQLHRNLGRKAEYELESIYIFYKQIYSLLVLRRIWNSKSQNHRERITNDLNGVPSQDAGSREDNQKAEGW
jgi:hypothetical protein